MKGMTQNLLIDIGNTNVHCALINGEVVGKSLKLATDLFESMNFKEDFNLGFGKRTLVSSVRHISDSLKIRIDGFFNNVLYLSPDLRWPFKSDYKTPKTLGPDRVASVAGAQKIYPETACLVIDAGTCITYDLIDHKGVYRGGAIIPGLRMQYQALYEKTGMLPLVEPDIDDLIFDDILKSALGKSTHTSMQMGVSAALTILLQTIIVQFKNKYPGLKVLLTGGDAPFFERRLKNEIFASLNLNLIGLNAILEHN